LYIGATWRGSNAQSFRSAFEALGHSVVAIETEACYAHYGRSLALRAAYWHLRRPLRRHTRVVREEALEAARTMRPELVFACKANYFDGDLLEDIRKASGALLLHWHPDDYRNPLNSSSEFRNAIPVYDVQVTPKTSNVAEFAADGARRVEFVPYSYDPEVHRPVPPGNGSTRDAVFVGTFERDRAGVLERAAREGIDLEVWGGVWDRLPKASPLRAHCRYREVLGDEMAATLASARLCLGFLRKANRDLHTARTFEIPACGGVMLTERTDEQRSFFEEGKEALYFDDAGEMIATIRDYVKRPDDLARIRAAALLRCRTSRYSYAERLSDLLARIAR
jgi:hypothetical protein